MNNPAFKEYSKTMISFGIILLIFFSCILGSLNESENSCPNTNHELNRVGIVFSTFGLLISLVILFYSTYIQINNRLNQ